MVEQTINADFNKYSRKKYIENILSKFIITLYFNCVTVLLNFRNRYETTILKNIKEINISHKSTFLFYRKNIKISKEFTRLINNFITVKSY